MRGMLLIWRCPLGAVAVNGFVRLQATGSVVFRIASDTKQTCACWAASCSTEHNRTGSRGRPNARALELPLDVAKVAFFSNRLFNRLWGTGGHAKFVSSLREVDTWRIRYRFVTQW
ncbi:hypothetical protein BDV06DRAFT_195118 [Aspergillus oleicola]